MRGRLGRALHSKADGERGQVERNPAQVSSPIRCVLHFNSGASQLQQEDSNPDSPSLNSAGQLPIPTACSSKGNRAVLELFFPDVAK
jgi:hypothetical protein